MKLVFYISFFSFKKKERVAATPFEEGSYTFQASISELENAQLATNVQDWTGVEVTQSTTLLTALFI